MALRRVLTLIVIVSFILNNITYATATTIEKPDTLRSMSTAVGPKAQSIRDALKVPNPKDGMPAVKPSSTGLQAMAEDEIALRNNPLFFKPSSIAGVTAFNFAEQIEKAKRFLRDGGFGIHRLTINAKEQTLSLNLSYTNITDITPLQDLTTLTKLDLYNTNIIDLGPLQDLTNLTWLDLYKTNITDITPLQDLTNLTKLNLSYTNITDITTLQDLTNLITLDLSHTNITDIAPLKDLTNLIWLNLSYTDITALAPLQDLTNLTKLYLSNTNITGSTPLRYLVNLTTLDLSSTNITDLDLLPAVKNLTKLYLYNTSITNKQIYRLFQMHPNRNNLVVTNSNGKTIKYDDIPAEYKKDPGSKIYSFKSSSAGTILTNDDLAQLFTQQRQGNWRAIQDAQQFLKATFIDNYEKAWQVFIAKHPSIRPVFDVTNPQAQSFKITLQIADQYNLRGHFKEFDKKADASTAGIRHFIDPLHSENPEKMYNDMFIALLITAEAEFLRDVHSQLRKNIPIEQGRLAQFIEGVRNDVGAENIAIIEQIYNMPFDKIIPFVRDNIVKLVGGEVKVHTPKFVEMEARMLADKGITVIVPERYDATVTIYMYSFLTYLLGACGATHYTSSHSANYVYGRKALAPDGSQLLPDIYENYRRILWRIIDDEIYKQCGSTVKMAEDANPRILHTLTYDRMVGLYKSILNITPEDIATINQATEKGHRIVLNCLNGSTWRTVSELLRQLGINPDVFTVIMKEEDKFFNAGYVVTEKRDKQTGKVTYDIDHLGIDTTMVQVARTIPYGTLAKDQPVGRKIYELDPDSDRFVLKEILPKTDEIIRILTEYAIDYYDLGDNRILIVPSPNKLFLNLDIADVEHLQALGVWDKFTSLYFITYVSSRAWTEFADVMQGLMRVMARVGYKNLTELQRMIEDWYFHKPNEPEFTFKDQLGRNITLNRQKMIRIHSKQEESGGRVAGMNKPCYNILGQQVLAMPEKSAADTLLSELTLSSKLFLCDPQHYSFLAFMNRAFTRYGLKSKVDFRIDLLHGDQGSIAMLEHNDQERALAICGTIKDNFNNFFFSVARAARDGEITIEKVIAILTTVLPEFKDTWACLSEITLSDEPLSKGRTRPEGVPMVFVPKNGKTPIVTEFDFRPSGTDALKSKIYADAEAITKEQKEEIEEYFKALAGGDRSRGGEIYTGYDLFAVLEHFGIRSITERPVNFAETGLKTLELGRGPQIAKSSSAGEAFDRFMGELSSVQHILLNADIADIDTGHLLATKQSLTNIGVSLARVGNEVTYENKQQLEVFCQLQKTIIDLAGVSAPAIEKLQRQAIAALIAA